jgi:hypothetical protein
LQAQAGGLWGQGRSAPQFAGPSLYRNAALAGGDEARAAAMRLSASAAPTQQPLTERASLLGAARAASAGVP